MFPRLLIRRKVILKNQLSGQAWLEMAWDIPLHTNALFGKSDCLQNKQKKNIKHSDEKIKQTLVQGKCKEIVPYYRY